ncbi:MAG: golvesin C-terminal-like domain-containing protein [Armatimonadota bacterium]
MTLSARLLILLLPSTALLLCLAQSCTRASEARSIYGIHDHEPRPTEYLNRIKAKVGAGWVTATVEVGSNPADQSGVDFRSISSEGHTVICRINNGYGLNGTIPVKSKYDDFAQRCANFVRNSQGCNIWVIGNETNLASEWPLDGGRLRYISPQDYAECFRKVYNAIKAVRPNDRVIPQALAPWAGPYGSGTIGGYPHDPMPLNWVQYMNQMLTAIAATGPLDGIALHINSRGYSTAAIHSTAKMNAGGMLLYSSFYVYKDWIDYGIPSSLYHLPLYATECNGYFYWKGGHPEDPSQHYLAGWMQEIYAEIDRHNRQAVLTGKPVFRCVNMYRWCDHCDGWNIDGASNPYRAQILSDLDAALDAGYFWPDPDAVIVDNSDAGFSVVSGVWSVGTIATDKYGADYRWKSTVGATGAGVVRWTPQLQREGMYDVAVWYSQGANRAPDAPYTVESLNGDQTFRVDQRANGGRWVSLGRFPMVPARASVRLSDNAGPSVVIADAVRWEYRGELPSTGSLTGTVRDVNGAPVAGATVVIEGQPQTMVTGSAGTYTFTGLRAGLYTVTASKPGYTAHRMEGVAVGEGVRQQDFTLGCAQVERIGAVRSYPNGTVVALQGKVVTENAGSWFWMQEPDRSAAIRVAGAWPSVAAGDVVSVSGTLGLHGNERAITGAAVLRTGSAGIPAPVSMRTRDIAGPPVAPHTPGVTRPPATGLHTVGLRVRATGVVTSSSPPSGFYLDDGCALTDGSGFGLRVTHWPQHATPAPGQMVSVVGNAGLYQTSGGNARLLWCGPTGSIEVLFP